MSEPQLCDDCKILHKDTPAAVRMCSAAGTRPLCLYHLGLRERRWRQQHAENEFWIEPIPASRS